MIKKEINLRTREFAIAREFYWPRVVAILGAIVVVAVLAAGTFVIYTQRLDLKSEITNLESQVKRLTVEVAPIEAMEAEISILRQRADLKDALTENIFLWTDKFKLFAEKAGNRDIRLTERRANEEGYVNIYGESAHLEPVAAYLQDLEVMDEIIDIHYVDIRFDSYDKIFKFRYEATFGLPGGEDLDD